MSVVSDYNAPIYYMKKSITILLLMSSFFSFSQEVKDEFLGEIHSVSEIFYDDETAFIKSANRYKQISDSTARQDYLKNPKSLANSKYPSLEARLNHNKLMDAIALRFGIENSGRPKIKRWMFSQSFVKMYTSEQNTLLLNRRTAEYYNHYKMNRTTNKQELAHYTFYHTEPESVVIDKDDIKKIAWLTCYKATISFRNSVFASIKDSNHKIIYEMYVTDSIKSKYSPFTHNLAILNKFYPMYIKKYDTGLRGRYYEDKIVKVASLRTTPLKELRDAYKKLKDSILAKYPPLLTIDDILNGKTKKSDDILNGTVDKKKRVPFKEQLEVLESLGYKLNPKVSLKDMERELIINGVIDTSKVSMEEFFTSHPYSNLYYHMGWVKFDKKTKEMIPYTGKCIWYDLEFIDPNSEYMTLMKRMGDITNGELSFSNMSINIDSENYEWIHFEVNGIRKKWKLQKYGYIDDSFFSRFVYLTDEFKTKRKFTYFNDDSQQFVIDYATPEEQEEFIQKTGIQREWLTVGKHFSQPKD